MIGWILKKKRYIWKNDNVKGGFNSITLALTASVLSTGTSFLLCKYYLKMKNKN